jgi:hypothetical protein
MRALGQRTIASPCLASGRFPCSRTCGTIFKRTRAVPEKLNPEVDTTIYQQVFPMLPSMSWADQKRALREVISSLRRDAEVMTHPQTDPRPLMLRAEAL